MKEVKKSWKGERASYGKTKRKNYRSNKYRTERKADTTKRPKPGSRSKAWVGAHTRKGKIKVRGHYRKL